MHIHHLKCFQRNIKCTDGCRYAVGSFGSLELSQRQCCLQVKISWLTSQDKNYRDGKNANGRLKSANSPSELSNKGCPLICIKDQTIPLWIFQQAGESGPNGQSVTVVSYDHTGHGHGHSTTKISGLTFTDLWIIFTELQIWRECQWMIQICQLLI